MLRAEIIYNRGQHLSRFMTGLHLLEKQKVLTCNYLEQTQPLIPNSHQSVLEMRIQGKRIFFDLGDRSALNHKTARPYLEAADAWFERSHEDWSQHGELAELSKKVHPFGLDYFTTYPGNPARKKRETLLQNIKVRLRELLGYAHVRSFEKKADKKKEKPKIIFMSRLWDPAEIDLTEVVSPERRSYREYMVWERETINRTRIELCRRLREIYGHAFWGGIVESDYAVTQCPDLILPKRMTRQRNYLKRMQRADICIGSAGLHKSIGWKTAEYVASSRAIVCEKPVYLLPGDFSEGKNYLSFTDVEGCLAAVKALYEDPQRVFEMKKANEHYYRKYLRPDVQIRNALRRCGLPV